MTGDVFASGKYGHIHAVLERLEDTRRRPGIVDTGADGAFRRATSTSKGARIGCLDLKGPVPESASSARQMSFVVFLTVYM